jgi:prepilin-type processing-associated H-X9-DG protein
VTENSFSFRRFQTNSFTLTELLVVICILSVLAALLMPALKSARESVRLTYCVSNLRQLTISAFQYADDNNGFLPLSFDVSRPNWYSTWASMVRHYLARVNGGAISDYPLNDYTLNPNGIPYDFRNLTSNDNINNRVSPIFNNPFFCPATRGPFGTPFGVTISGSYTDYALNSNLAGYNAPGYYVVSPTPLAALKNPAQTLLFCDNSRYYIFSNVWPSQSPRHCGGTRCNMSAADGHVESIRATGYWGTWSSPDFSRSGSASSPSASFKMYGNP